MNHTPFVGRKYELNLLNDLLEKKVANLVVIKGRRRIGKSRLVEEFARHKKYYIFSGLPPTSNTTAQSQRDEFARQLALQSKVPEVRVDDWTKLFLLLAKEVGKNRTVILFDEISWMGSKDPDFLGKLKNAWDLHFKKNPKLILILCGSVSSWIEKNIISSTGFFGRISLKLTLGELPLNDCNTLLHHLGFDRSPLEKFQILSVVGGVPWYLESINPAYSATDNIKRLCFTKDGLLVDEFKFIFEDLYGRRGEICKKIVEYLAKGSAEYAEIAAGLNYYSSGALSEYLEDLLISGFISRDYTWSLKSSKDTMKLSKFRLSDNYLRFYLKYISPRLNQIKKDQFAAISLISLPNLDGIMGLQFENLVLNNRRQIQEYLMLKPEEILSDNPYFQHQTTKQKGCQIDYLIQTRYNTLFACEIKFSKKEIDNSIVNEMKEKVSKIILPRGFACLPVLIHVSGVNEEVKNSNYFFKLIDFGKLFFDKGLN
ncbi:MAG: ATP-binding protein [Alphaproteobacteria bacterium]|nr:ATP-binding protein [Alphaproteobacteria bacterium]